MTMANLITIEGVGNVYAAKLKEGGIQTTEALLEAGKTPQGRKAIADKTGISDVLILKWINRVDLFRIKGIGEEYADLLEAAGVDTVPELAQRNAENLHGALAAKNQEKRLVRQMPGLSQVSEWIEQAKALPRVVSY
jgi:predicted flap endonuclease-1-like 5' DNA nuclease